MSPTFHTTCYHTQSTDPLLEYNQSMQWCTGHVKVCAARRCVPMCRTVSPVKGIQLPRRNGLKPSGCAVWGSGCPTMRRWSWRRSRWRRTRATGAAAAALSRGACRPTWRWAGRCAHSMPQGERETVHQHAHDPLIGVEGIWHAA